MPRLEKRSKELFGVVRLPPAPSPQQFAQQAWYPQNRAILWVSVVHPEICAKRIQKDQGSKELGFSCYSQVEETQGAVMAPAHCPERKTPRSRVSFRESLGNTQSDSSRLLTFKMLAVYSTNPSKHSVKTCGCLICLQTLTRIKLISSWPLQLKTILKHHQIQVFPWSQDVPNFESPPHTRSTWTVETNFGFGGANPRRNCTPVFFSCKCIQQML